MDKMLKLHDFHEIQIGFSPNPIPALACLGTSGLGLPSSRKLKAMPLLRASCPPPLTGPAELFQIAPGDLVSPALRPAAPVLRHHPGCW